MMGFLEFLKLQKIPILNQIILVTNDDGHFQYLDEGKWMNGRFDKNIRIDHSTRGAGQTHAHILGRNRNQLGVVNFDGSGSHGSKMRLHKKDADALRNVGFKLPKNNLVEWTALLDQPQILFE